MSVRQLWYSRPWGSEVYVQQLWHSWHSWLNLMSSGSTSGQVCGCNTQTPVHKPYCTCVWLQHPNTCPQTWLRLCVVATPKHLSTHLTAPVCGCNTQTPVHKPYLQRYALGTYLLAENLKDLFKNLSTHLLARWLHRGSGRSIRTLRHISRTQSVSLCRFCNHNPGHPNRTQHWGPITTALPPQPSDHQRPNSQPTNAALVTSRQKHWRQMALVGSRFLAPSAAIVGNGSQWFFVKNDMPPVSSEGHLWPRGSTSEQVHPSTCGASPA